MITIRRMATFGLIAGLLAGIPVVGAESASEPAGPGASSSSRSRFVADLSLGYFSGDYGTGEQTDVEIVSPRLRWHFPRGEIRASFPFLRVDTTGDVIFVGGQPVAAGSSSSTSTEPVRGTLASAVPTVRRVRDRLEGPGDVRLHGELDLLRGRGLRPWLTGVVKVKLPTADEQQGLGTGETDVEGGLSLVQPLGRTSLLADARYTRVGDPDEIDYEDVRSLGAGVAYRVGGSRTGYLYAYVENRTHPTPGRVDRLDLSIGGSRKFGSGDQVRLAGSAFVGLSRSAEDLGVTLTVGRAF